MVIDYAKSTGRRQAYHIMQLVARCACVHVHLYVCSARTCIHLCGYVCTHICACVCVVHVLCVWCMCVCACGLHVLRRQLWPKELKATISKWQESNLPKPLPYDLVTTISPNQYMYTNVQFMGQCNIRHVILGSLPPPSYMYAKL